MYSKQLLCVGFLGLLVLSGCGSDNDRKNTSSTSSVSSSSESSVSSVSSSSESSSSEPGSSSSSVAPPEQLTGTAAVGAPIVGGNVVAKCADGSGFIGSVTTNAQGIFTGLVASGALPCALQISGGTPTIILHSYAANVGTVNITPLTDLILANASNQAPADWFANPDWANIANTIATAQVEIKTALEGAGYTLPSGDFIPFNIPFVIGDTWDQLLDQIQAAIDESVVIENYLALVSLIQSGNLASFPVNVGSSSSSSSSSSSLSSSSSSSSSSVGLGNAESCYNPALFETGARVINQYRTTDAAGPVIEFTYDSEVKGETTFNNQAVLYSVSTTEAVGAAPSNSVSTAYFTKDNTAKRSTIMGVKVVVSSPLAITTTTTNNPGRLTRYDLQPDESYSQTLSATTAITSAFPVPPVAPVDISFTTTFKGIESINVPAGTYDACRFETQEGGIKTTRWFAVDKGTELRVESDGDVTVYLSGTLNGVAQ